MLQIQRVFSPQIRNREPFATGWWRRERDCIPTFSRRFAPQPFATIRSGSNIRILGRMIDRKPQQLRAK